MEKMIRILLADDHPLVRAGIRSILSNEPQIQLVGEATDAHEAQRMSQDLKPDVLLLDLNMPGPLPIETVSFLRLCCPTVIVLVLSAHDDDSYVHNLIAAGASGYVLKDEAPETVIQAIQTVVKGGSWFSRSVVNKLFHFKRENQTYITEEKLTEREQQLISMVAQGWSNARIATELHLAEQTVRNYMSHLYIKLNIQSRGEAIVWARERGLSTHKK